jgi:transcriptional regulator with XRE-family HTH domain
LRQWRRVSKVSNCLNLLIACLTQGRYERFQLPLSLEYDAVPSDDASERRREIGRRVARWRTRRGITLGQFAELCDRSLSWVDKVESGERGLLRLPMLERVAEVLHVSVEDLADTTEVRQARHCLDLFEISTIRSVLRSYQAISRVFVPLVAEMNAPPDLDRLTQQVTYAWTVYQNTHWPLLGQTLPRLLTTAQTAVAAYPGEDDQARRARSLLSQVYQVPASTLYKLEEFDLAWLAAERGFVLAEETGESLLIGAATRQAARGLMFLNTTIRLSNSCGPVLTVWSQSAAVTRRRTCRSTGCCSSRERRPPLVLISLR